MAGQERGVQVLRERSRLTATSPLSYVDCKTRAPAFTFHSIDHISSVAVTAGLMSSVPKGYGLLGVAGGMLGVLANCRLCLTIPENAC